MEGSVRGQNGEGEQKGEGSAKESDRHATGTVRQRVTECHVTFLLTQLAAENGVRSAMYDPSSVHRRALPVTSAPPRATASSMKAAERSLPSARASRARNARPPTVPMNAPAVPANSPLTIAPRPAPIAAPAPVRSWCVTPPQFPAVARGDA